jgi:OOP family OmpA-OmpF porin
MTVRTLMTGAACAAALLLSTAAQAGPGWYVGVSGGGTLVDDIDYSGLRDPDAPGPNAPLSGTWDIDEGWAVLASAGYALATWRVEFEGGYRQNAVGNEIDIDVDAWSLTFNVIHDIRLSNAIDLSVGGGLGADRLTVKMDTAGFDDTDWSFAAQAIAGLSFELTPQLDLTLNYRYRWTDGTDLASRITTEPASETYALDDFGTHIATIGLRYSLDAPNTVPMPTR